MRRTDASTAEVGEVIAHITEDGTLDMLVDGSATVRLIGDSALAREVAVSDVVTMARERGGPVVLLTSGAEGAWRLSVGPDGSVLPMPHVPVAEEEHPSAPEAVVEGDGDVAASPAPVIPEVVAAPPRSFISRLAAVSSVFPGQRRQPGCDGSRSVDEPQTSRSVVPVVFGPPEVPVGAGGTDLVEDAPVPVEEPAQSWWALSEDTVVRPPQVAVSPSSESTGDLDEELERTVVMAPEARTTHHAVLHTSSGDSIEISGAGVIGRRPRGTENAVVFPGADLTISNSHLAFTVVVDGLLITDQGSVNGTVIRHDGAEFVCVAGREEYVPRGGRVDLGGQFFVVV